jgi:geranylgeranyl reductase family protein
MMTRLAKEERIWDVIVVGAGPAGAIAAFELAKSGMQVLIIEKEKLPRMKVCAGGLTTKARKAIPFDVSPVIDLEASGGMLTYKGKLVLKADLQKPLASLVNRSEFDHFLTQQAQKQGADLLDGLKVVSIKQKEDFVLVKTAQGTYSGRYLVGADGVNSRVARDLGLSPDREKGYAVEAELVVPNATLTNLDKHVVFDFGALRYGYGWIFPKSDHLSVGVCYAKQDRPTGMKDKLYEFIHSQPMLHTYTVRSIHGHPGPIGGIKADLHRGRCLVVGDAANLADAWMGEGLYYAIESGKIASQSIIDAQKQAKSDLKNYSKQVNQGINQQLYYARRLARLIYGMPGLANWLIRHNQQLMEMTFDLIRGDMSFESLHHILKRKWFKILTAQKINDFKRLKSDDYSNK